MLKEITSKYIQEFEQVVENSRGDLDVVLESEVFVIRRAIKCHVKAELAVLEARIDEYFCWNFQADTDEFSKVIRAI